MAQKTTSRLAVMVIGAGAVLVTALPVFGNGVPVAYYPFDGDTNDYSGNDLHGTKTDAVVYAEDRYGVADNAVEFTHPSDARIALGNHTEFNELGNEFTITFWTKINPSEGGNVVDHDIVGTTYDWMLGVVHGVGAHAGKPHLLLGAPDGNDTFYADTPVDDSAWHHVVIRREQANGGNVWFSVDGLSDGFYTGYADDYIVSTGTNLGPSDGSGGWDSNGLVGSLDDLRFYNRLLTDLEVMDMARGCGVACYSFDGNADDHSGNNLHGTPTGVTFSVCDARFEDPEDSRIAPGNHSEFNDLGNEFTITFWTKINPDEGGNVVDHDRFGTTYDWMLGVVDGVGTHAGKPYLLLGSPGGNTTRYADTRVDDGGWHHVAIRREQASGNLWFFRDGLPDGSHTELDQDVNVSEDTNIGPSEGDSNGLVGSIDELRFYDRLLLDDEIAILASHVPCADNTIPTVSEWGVVAMTLLLLTAGTLVFMKRRLAVT